MRQTGAGVALAALLLAGGAQAQEEPAKQKSAAGLFGALAGGSSSETKAPPPPAPAKVPARALVSGQTLTATLEGAPTSPNGNLYHCYQLQTGWGSQWKIEIEQKKVDGKFLPAVVLPGNSCLGAGYRIQSKASYVDLGYFGGTGYKTTGTFAASGGPYAVAVLAKPSDGFGEYKITATRIGADGAATTGLLMSAAELRFAKADGKATASMVEPRDAKKYATGDVITDCPECPQMVVIPAGNFIMGSSAAEEDRGSDEGPAHRVTFAHPFAMGVTEVTFAEWDACASAGACRKVKDDWGRGKRPVTNVTWGDANSYAAWLSEKTGERYFIPSEAEWEYAARAGTKTPWNTGSGIVSDDANIMNAFKQTVPVGGFEPNAWGLKDMHGNVWEWTFDCHEVGYFGVPNDGGAAVTPNCEKRVTRGGGFDSEPQTVRSANRGSVPMSGTAKSLGFRVARAL